MKSEGIFLLFTEGNLKTDRIEGEVSQSDSELIKFTAPGTRLDSRMPTEGGRAEFRGRRTGGRTSNANAT